MVSKMEHIQLLLVDLQQAYDRVWRKGLLLKIQRLGINGNLYRWIKSFVHERTIQTKFEDKVSSHHTLEEGLLQGSALSCTLFLIYINDLAKEVRCNKALYADDLVIWHTHRYARQSARYINLDLERLQKYCDTWKITINTNKTSYSIFTLSPKVTKQNLNIRLSDQQLKKEEHPSYLGVQLDPRLNLKKHAANLKRKTMKRLSLIKRLASTSWGSGMDTLRSLYLGYVRSVLDYNLCLQASSSKTVQSEIDRVQNHVLRFI
ncbi:RNA-directed DNA polymerase from mobile element jockey [Elysia marginata]|uniref:RNA-directed DNA polymerase from mobile element jockey n=1 Tax=Elysia marginata TaxID=1093978 RepID=A0AAV4IB68_9GAST|nr:RNA-directed DNA polymerase from mobile element jockey [Elysia marginata]